MSLHLSGCIGRYVQSDGALMQEEERSKAIACYRCRYYRVTWDVRFPYGCDAHRFKTRQSPSLVVFEASGIPCQLFERKSSPPV